MVAAAPLAVAAAPTAASFAVSAEGPVDRRLVATERQVTMPSAATMATLRAAQIHRLDRPISAVAGFTLAASTPAALTDEVLFLAAILKPVGECPNPDPALFAK